MDQAASFRRRLFVFKYTGFRRVLFNDLKHYP